MLEQNENWIASAAEALAGGASSIQQPITGAPRRKIGKAKIETLTGAALPSPPNSVAPAIDRSPLVARATETEHPQAIGVSPPDFKAPADTELADHLHEVPQKCIVSQTHSVAPKDERKPAGFRATEAVSGVGGHAGSGTLLISAPDPGIQRIVEECRRRMDMLRARQRLELQAQAICRRFVDGDKTEAAKLWAKVRKDEGHELRVWLQPFIAAMEPLDAAKHEIEKTLAKLVKELPVYAWAKTVSGFGDVSLAGVIGECGIGPGEYRSVSALWKRMGLAVIGGGRQRKIAGNEAIEHGYNAERRSQMWNIGGCLMKAQLRSEKDENGKKIEGSEYATGELGQVYLDRKAYLRERDPERSAAHIHNDAKRYMEKRLLRQLWQQWRQATGNPNTFQVVPAAVSLNEARKAA